MENLEQKEKAVKKAAQSMDIGDFISDAIVEDSDDGVWFEYPDIPTFTVKVAYLSRSKLRKMAEDLGISARKGFRTTKLASKSTEDDKFIRAYGEAAVKDWSGLTPNVLRELVLLKEEPPDGQDFACNRDNRFVLMKLSIAFAEWIDDVCRDVGLFNEARDEEVYDNLKKE